MENTLQALQLQQYHHQQDENSEFTCEICIEPMPNGARKFKNGNKCCHPFCMDCMIKYVHVQVNDNNVAEIPCPALNCDEMLDPVACGHAVGPSLFVRWCDVLCKFAISGLDKWYCPNRNCNALIVNECAVGRPVVKEQECPNCRKLFCFKCKGVWHGGRRCGNETEGINDVVLRNLVERGIWKRCPRCGIIVELIGGCYIVKCRCGIKFCYNCEMQASMCRCMANSFCSLSIIVGPPLMIIAALMFFTLYN